ncbi:MAG: hypothetical protein P4M08_15025 [Oligoflexia bacterium]|nr:hypothetical protein [Oligoflexia bacterium]
MLKLAKPAPILVCTACTLASACMPTNTGYVAFSTATSGSVSTSAALTLTPSQQTIAPGASLQLVASGGLAPYTYSIISGQGSINSSTGIYTAPSTPTSVQINAVDTTGVSGSATVTVAYPPLTISPASITLALGSTFTFSGSGGLPPYTFSMAYGAGLITSSGAYTAPSSGSSDQVMLEDANGDEAFADVTVGTGGISGGSSTNAGCSLLSALGDTAVQMSCDPSETLSAYGQSGSCGSTPQTGTAGTASWSVACSSGASVSGGAYCCASRVPGASYNRTITASGTTFVQAYCGVGETTYTATGSCTSVSGTLVPTTLPPNSSGQHGFSITCSKSTDTASLTITCQGTVPL